ncbi:pyridoxamine 5'-phosphate oxidase family protein [Pyruvatibacter mobilis]|uniref:pyridoxamine 5'-phosphate oxidase family protein n=1 Tax=Pyruvatibacter mobilis TaxID=1712261 RepID=UPI003BAD3622
MPKLIESPASASHYGRSRETKMRVAKRAEYGRAAVHAILDEGYVAHIAFVTGGKPVCIPIFYVRDGESLLIHGSRKTRMFTELASGLPLCATVTHLDGLVLARSWFHHSMNYRSVMVHGAAEEVRDEAARMEAMWLFMERIAEGRADGSRAPNAQEMKATMVLRIPLETAVAKVRTGGPNDDAEDMGLPYWAGVVPVETRHLAPEVSADMQVDAEVPEGVLARCR